MTVSRPGENHPCWTVVDPTAEHWPPLWRQLPDPPEQVYVSGDPAALLKPAVAIVGTRRATVRATAFARALAAALSGQGYTIASGLARGVDAAAHLGALDVDGCTMAVMGTGIDLTYPRGHESLRRQVEKRGCCLSEFPPGTPPRKFHFPLRNRLLAGLVRAVVVVEAPLRSGALITAQLALDYNREVFAVPGPVELRSSRGCHQLLREGAQLLESAPDLVRVLGVPENVSAQGVKGRPDPPRSLPVPGSSARWILDRLDFEGVPLEDLLSRWAGSREAWSEGLLALELADLIKRLPGGILARNIW
jgi:DNA processing protein